MDLWLVILLVVAVIIALWAYFTAQRLNRLHIRTDAARSALNAALDRRAAVVATAFPELSGPARAAEAVVLDHGAFDRRASVERALDEYLDSVGDFPPQLVDAHVRIELAQRFYNEAVSDTRALRLRPAVRALRLGGTAPLPEFFDF